MTLEDVKVGMRLRSTLSESRAFSPVTVTELTARGFKYRLDAPVCIHPRLGIAFAAEGHEHFAIDGKVPYEPIPAPPNPPA